MTDDRRAHADAGTPSSARRAGDRDGRDRRDDDLRRARGPVAAASPARSATAASAPAATSPCSWRTTAPFLEVLWAAQRSGLHYTAINRHLRPAEVQYVLDDCGATALVSSAAMAEVVAGLDLVPDRDPGVRRRATSTGSSATTTCSPPPQPGPLADEQEGREMLYSSGTTGRPKGVRKALPGTPFGDPTAAPVQIAQGIGDVRRRARRRLPLARAALPRRAARVLDVDAPARRAPSSSWSGSTPQQCLAAHRAPPGDPRPVRADDVRADAPPPRGGASALRRLEPAGRRARRRAVPGRRSSGR